MMENRSNADLIQARLCEIREKIAVACAKSSRDLTEIHLMAVTKTVPAEIVNLAIQNGVSLLGENRAQELCEKYAQYQTADAAIHFIGHLQTNKVKSIIDKVDVIQSLDSVRLAQEIERQCTGSRVMNCFVEVNIGDEPSKSGVKVEDLVRFLQELAHFEHIRVCGLMAIPPISDSISIKEQYFSKMQKLFIDIKREKLDNVSMDFLSMGMSEDYELAVQYGSNIVRLGHAIFGMRRMPTARP